MKKVIFTILILTMSFSLIYSNDRIIDKGIGVAFIKGSLPINRQNSGFLLLYDSSLVEIVGKFSYCINDTIDNFRIISNYVFECNLFEFEYESMGLPIIGRDKEKLKVLIGIDKSGISITGWIKLTEKYLDYYLWESYLVKKELFFLNTKSMYFFYNEPNGKRVDYCLFRNNSKFSQYLEKEYEYDYIMYPIERNGVWLKVEVVSPSDYCEEVIKPKKITFWIKYLNENGRPLVWYYTRGC